MADAMIFKPGDLPECCTETLFQSHEELVVRVECRSDRSFLHSFLMCTNPLPDTGKGFCFCCEKHVSDLHI